MCVSRRWRQTVASEKARDIIIGLMSPTGEEGEEAKTSFFQLLEIIWTEFRVQAIMLIIMSTVMLIGFTFFVLVLGRMTCACHQEIREVLTEVAKDKTVKELQKAQRKINEKLKQLKQGYKKCQETDVEMEMATMPTGPIGAATREPCTCGAHRVCDCGDNLVTFPTNSEIEIRPIEIRGGGE